MSTLHLLRSSFCLLPFFLGACTDTVFRDREPFNPPADATGKFLGFFTVSDKQTTCGNCHVGEQADWVQTKHASAWEDLQSSPSFGGSCAGAGCHSVNWRGNQDGPANVGYDAVQDSTYHGVQCESCHGPGFDHVQNPSVDANRPLASINVTDDPALEDRSCSGCHRAGAGPDGHHDYLGEWRASRHGQLRESQAEEVGCQPCHEAKGALRAFNVTTNYRELGNDAVLMPQNCVVCHDPHGSAKGPDGQPFPGQLRFSISSPVQTENLCTRCHGRVDRTEATATNSRGPHGPQGPVLFGTAGYFPPGTVYDTTAILASHGSQANQRLCAGCHVNTLTGRDASGNTVTFSGHTFNPIPCLESKSGTEGIVDPTYTRDCAYDEPSRSWKACTASGCHGTEAVAASLLNGISNERNGYINTIWQDLNSNRSLDAAPTDGGYLATIKANLPGEVRYCNLTGTSNLCATAQDSIDSQRLTPAKGALFNAQLFGEALTGHPDGSHGVHNPFLYRAVLQSTIADLEANYGGILPSPPAPVLSQIRNSIQSGTLRLSPKLEQAIMRAN
jgi:hypothetical protein